MKNDEIDVDKGQPPGFGWGLSVVLSSLARSDFERRMLIRIFRILCFGLTSVPLASTSLQMVEHLALS